MPANVFNFPNRFYDLHITHQLFLEGSAGDVFAEYYNGTHELFQYDTYRGSDGRRVPICMQPEGGNVLMGTYSSLAGTKLEVVGGIDADTFSCGGSGGITANIDVATTTTISVIGGIIVGYS